MTSKRYLITGTAGFIGYHLANKLCQEGHEVVGIDAVVTSQDTELSQHRHALLQQHHTNFRAVLGDLRDKDVVEHALLSYQPDVVVHLAAQTGVRNSLKDPAKYLECNVTGSLNVLEAVKGCKSVRHLLIASTSSVYGNNARVPFRETDRADEPLSFYAATKKSVETMAHSYSHNFDIPVTVFRFFTVYGPLGRPDMALYKFTAKILNGEPLPIYGHGQMLRDMTYIDDLVHAVSLLAQSPPHKDKRFDVDCKTMSLSAPMRIVNIGGGEPVKLMDFVELLQDHLGITARYEMLPMQPGDVVRTYASPDLLFALTGYIPDTPLSTGIAAFIKWYLLYHVGLREPATTLIAKDLS